MPHARQGGSGKFGVTCEGSKLDGTELAKEQIGHIQVPPDCFVGVVVGLNGLLVLVTGEDAEPKVVLDTLSKPGLGGFE